MGVVYRHSEDVIDGLMEMRSRELCGLWNCPPHGGDSASAARAGGEHEPCCGLAWGTTKHFGRPAPAWRCAPRLSPCVRGTIPASTTRCFNNPASTTWCRQPRLNNHSTKSPQHPNLGNRHLILQPHSADCPRLRTDKAVLVCALIEHVLDLSIKLEVSAFRQWVIVVHHNVALGRTVEAICT